MQGFPGRRLEPVPGATDAKGQSAAIARKGIRRHERSRVSEAGNLVGAILTAALMLAAKQYTFGCGAVGREALTIAAAKTNLGFGQAIALGMFCNALVCLAVWLTYSARTTTDRILAVIPPIAAFVAAGFEHSVANMYFIPIGLLVKTQHGWLAGQEGLPDLSGLTWGSLVTDNLVPVTIGNLIGGAIMVGALYWFVYLRRRPA